MSDVPDLRDLLGDDVPDGELARLRRADELLRATPAPPDVPATLTASVLAIPGRRRREGSRRRLFAGVAFAAALAAGTFGIGVWVSGDAEGPPPIAERLTLVPTSEGPEGATMVLDVLPIDAAGNWPMAADVTGLPALPADGFYEVWMTKNGALAVSCGRFVVDDYGVANDVWLNAPYRFVEYERWVVVSVMPGQPPSAWLLDGPVTVPA